MVILRASRLNRIWDRQCSIATEAHQPNPVQAAGPGICLDTYLANNGAVILRPNPLPSRLAQLYLASFSVLTPEPGNLHPMSGLSESSPLIT